MTDRAVAVMIERGSDRPVYDVLVIGEKAQSNRQIDRWHDVYVVPENEVMSLLDDELDVDVDGWWDSHECGECGRYLPTEDELEEHLIESHKIYYPRTSAGDSA
ncbi:hypothetical protein [Halopenitus persicus]|uniref:hypothetical protein n=1 Tax=Halopenitus persicus TaxID=1048396 RepID=UPI000BBACACB|nr:hypothetical protein [Halopenitus persicus]